MDDLTHGDIPPSLPGKSPISGVTGGGVSMVDVIKWTVDFSTESALHSFFCGDVVDVAQVAPLQVCVCVCMSVRIYVYV